jgi:hypothetical protein
MRNDKEREEEEINISRVCENEWNKKKRESRTSKNKWKWGFGWEDCCESKFLPKALIKILLFVIIIIIISQRRCLRVRVGVSECGWFLVVMVVRGHLKNKLRVHN